jgi:predicted esterase
MAERPDPALVSRRRFLLAGGASMLLAACDGGGTFRDGRVGPRPSPSTLPRPGPGLQRLGDPDDDLGLLYVPHRLPPGPRPLMVCFHGASGSASGGMRLFRRYADELGVVVAAPQSLGPDWDLIISGGFGADVPRIARAVDWLLARFRIDPRHLASAGFSDGATYSLSFGLSNGDLFSHVIALSPGFFSPGELSGRPPVFVAHGTQDRVLPIDRASRVIVPELRDAGYDVTYVEFEGRHHPDLSVTRRAVEWFLGSGGSAAERGAGPSSA